VEIKKKASYYVHMEIWYSLTGGIDPNVVNQAIGWINGQIYNTPGLNKIKFLISSTGGDGDSAIRLYDYLKALPVQVDTIGFGQVDSAAITIFLAGENRIAVKDCRFIIHEGIYNIAQPSAPMHLHEEVLSLFNEISRRNTSIIVKETKRKVEEIKKLAKEGKPLTCEEAKKIGLVTEIVEKLPLVSQIPPTPQPVQ
jgi:ATP-dependent protease ClpP protease subunit